MAYRFRTLCIFSIILMFLSLGLFKQEVIAHSGRTDSQGGHRDNSNASGLGSYHFHHGMGPHLHPNGICPYSPKDTIKVVNMPTTMDVGDSVYLSWETTYYSGISNVEWTSSNSEVVFVSNQGVLEAKNPGKVVLTAKLHNGLRTFNVTSREVTASSIRISDSPSRIPIGNTTMLTYSLHPLKTTNTIVKWESSNPQIASINSNGMIRAVGSGVVVISATTSNGKKDHLEIEVFEVRPITIQANSDNLKLTLGESTKLIVEVIPNNTSNKRVNWTEYDSNIISVEKNGVIVAKNIGTTSIKLVCQDVSKEVFVDVLPIEVSEIVLDKNSIPYYSEDRLNVGVTFAPEFSIEPSNATDRTYVLSTDNSSVFSISGTSVKTIKSGEGKIIVTSGGVKEELYIRVVNFDRIRNYSIGGFISIIVGLAIKVAKRQPQT